MATTTTPRVAYHPPPETMQSFHGDGREQHLLAHLSSLSAQISGNPQAVLDAIDGFGEQEKYLMNVRAEKGGIVEGVIETEKPKTILELGTYVGYSTIRFARHLRAHLEAQSPPRDVKLPRDWVEGVDDSREWIGYICLEKEPAYAEVAHATVELAGLGDLVKIIVGPSSSSLRALRTTLNMPRPACFDFVFIDHYKPLYTLDLKILEEEGLVGVGTTIVADNVIKPGNPAYLAYVRASPAERRDGSGTVSEHEHARAVGDWRMRYESRMVESWEPYTALRDGVEVSRVVGFDEE